MSNNHTLRAVLSLLSLRRSALMRAGCTIAIVALCAGLAFGAERQIIRPKGTAAGRQLQPGHPGSTARSISPDRPAKTRTARSPASFEAEVKQALDNIGVVLDAAGMSPADVVSVQVYLTDGALFQRMNAVYTSVLQGSASDADDRGRGEARRAGHVEITATAKK